MATLTPVVTRTGVNIALNQAAAWTGGSPLPQFGDCAQWTTGSASGQALGTSQTWGAVQYLSFTDISIATSSSILTLVGRLNTNPSSIGYGENFYIDVRDYTSPTYGCPVSIPAGAPNAGVIRATPITTITFNNGLRIAAGVTVKKLDVGNIYLPTSNTSLFGDLVFDAGTPVGPEGAGTVLVGANASLGVGTGSGVGSSVTFSQPYNLSCTSDGGANPPAVTLTSTKPMNIFANLSLVLGSYTVNAVMSVGTYNPTISVVSGSTFTFNIVDGTHGFKKAGAGTVVIGQTANPSTLSGPVDVLVGVLQGNRADVTKDSVVTVASSASYIVNAASSTIGNIEINAGATLALQTNNTVYGALNNDTTVAGAVTGSGTLTKTGTGTTTFDGAATIDNPFVASGGTTSTVKSNVRRPFNATVALSDAKLVTPKAYPTGPRMFFPSTLTLNNATTIQFGVP